MDPEEEYMDIPIIELCYDENVPFGKAFTDKE
jgi:hypothetical protein